MVKTLLDSNGATIALGKQIAHGGEGAIYELPSLRDSLAKVYFKSPDSLKAEKLRLMPTLLDVSLANMAAWPTRTLHDPAGRAVVGFVMPRANDHHEIHHLYSPTQQATYFPGCTWKFLVHVAMNCAAAVDTVHARGHVIGDLNQSGFLVAKNGTVKLIDCDSFQIRRNGTVYRCLVGVPHYTAPEIAGKHFAHADRSTQHDCFALAVLIFHLLFMGRHPFAGKFLGSGDMPIERAIHEGRFAFSQRSIALQMQAPPYSLGLDFLPPPIPAMFEAAFTTLSRPTATQWQDALRQLLGKIVACPVDDSHQFPTGRTTCPWCEFERTGGPSFFSSANTSQEFDPAFDIILEWQRLVAIPSVPDPTVVKAPPLPSKRGTPLPSDACFRDLLPYRATPPEPKLVLENVPTITGYLPQYRVDDPPELYKPETVPAVEPEVDLPPPELEAMPLWPTLDDVPAIDVPAPDYETEPVEPAAFHLEVVPDDPPLELLDEDITPPPSIAPLLAKLEARRVYVVKSSDYQQAMVGCLGALVVAVAGCFVHWSVSLVAVAVFVPFAVVWFLLALPLRTTYYRPRAKLMAEYASAIQRHQSEQAARTLENQRQREHWKRRVAELAKARVGLQERNDHARAEWERQAKAYAIASDCIKRKNAALLHAWLRDQDAADTKRRQLLDELVAETAVRRNEIAARNGNRQRDWEAKFRDIIEERRQAMQAAADAACNRNRERREKWAAFVDREETKRRTAWEQEAARIREVQRSIETQNTERRRIWETGLRHFEAANAEVGRHNAQIETTKANYEKVLNARRATADMRLRDLKMSESSTKSKLIQLNTEWQQARSDAESARERFASLKQDFEQARDAQFGNAKQNQLDDHLRHALIDNAKIASIGPAKKAVLRSYGIESAFDVTESAVLDVPGFGPATCDKLMDWKRKVVSKFKFQPGKQVNLQGLKSLHARFRGPREDAKRRFLSARERMASLSKKGRELMTQFSQQISQSADRLAQASADLDFAVNY